MSIDWVPQLAIFGVFLLAIPLYKDFRKWVLHAYLFSNPVSQWVFKINFLTTADLFLFIMFSILFADICLGESNKYSLGWLQNSIFLFGLVAIISLLGSEYKKKALVPLFHYIKVLLLFLYILRYSSPKQIGELFWVFILSGIPPAIYGIFTKWETVLGLAGQELFFLRAKSTFSGPVEFGYQMAIRVGVLLALSWRLKSVQIALLKITLLLVFLLSVAISFTRNSYILIIIASIIVVFVRGINIIKERGIGNLVPYLGAVILIVFMILILLPSRVKSRFLMLGLGGVDPSIFSRPLLWMSAWKMFLDHPITGVGIGSYPIMFSEHYFPFGLPHYAKIGFVSAHSIIFMTLSELGILGAASLAVLLVSYGKAILSLIGRVLEPWRGYLIASLVLGIASFVFGLFDFVWIHERTATTTGILLALVALSIIAARESIVKLRDESYSYHIQRVTI